LVLLNDDFSSIVSAIRLGRRIFDNLKKAIAYIFSVHIPIAGMSLFPILFHLPIVLFPAHIAFLELIIDPACTVVFESEGEEHDIMKRKPRNLKLPLFGREAFIISLLEGVSSLFVVMFVFVLALYRGMGESEARTLAFVTVVFSNLLLIIVNLSYKDHIFSILRNRNKALYIVLAVTLGALFLCLYVPFLRSLFHFSLLHGDDIGLAFVLSCFGLVWFEGLKFIRRKNESGAI
jgi:P-type Ca2+ transporter type 2C